MNSTSAGERGGRVALVDEGSFLVGAPGAPGWTTAGFGESVCWANAAAEKKIADMAASRARDRMRMRRAEAGRGPRQEWIFRLLGLRVKGRIRTKM